MKVIGIACSPRPGGNTETMIREALAGAEEAGAEAELITLAGRNISPCDACEACTQSGECIIDDDLTPILEKMQQADGIILGAPVYFFNVSAQAKALMDRTYGLFSKRRLRDKVGGAVVVARRFGIGGAYDQINTFFVLHRLIVAGGAMGFGDQEGDVRGDEQAMHDAHALGRVVVRTIKRFAAPPA